MSLNAVAYDDAHSGLPCRAPARCTATFSVPARATLDDLLAVGRARDAHELAEHAYVHVVTHVKHSYQSGFTKVGRSLIGRKH